MSIARIFSLASVAIALASGCTAGAVVDANFNLYPVNGGGLTFQQVDSSSGDPSFYYPFTNYPYVVFDPYAPASQKNGNAPANVNWGLAAGTFFVEFMTQDPQGKVIHGASPVFYHDFSGSCTDYYTGKLDENCALYYFQVTNNSCPACCDNIGSCSEVQLATAPGQPQVRIIPISLAAD